MPIQINLLAETQAIEETRRRDPVKRVILGGVIVVLLVLAWSSSLMVKGMIAKGQLSGIEGDLNSRTNEWHQILENERKLSDTKQRLGKLQQLATNRFLIGNLLNALQQNTVDNVQLIRLKLNQAYIFADAVKPQEGETRVAPKPATATEKIVLTLEAKVSSPKPSESVNTFQEVLSTNTYFRTVLGGTNGFRLVNYGSPQTDADGKAFRFFTLEARFPDKTR